MVSFSAILVIDTEKSPQEDQNKKEIQRKKNRKFILNLFSTGESQNDDRNQLLWSLIYEKLLEDSKIVLRPISLPNSDNVVTDVMKNEIIAGVVNEKKKGRGAEGPEAAGICSHTLNFAFSAGKPHRLIHLPNDLLHRVINIFDQTQQKIVFLLHNSIGDQFKQ